MYYLHNFIGCVCAFGDYGWFGDSLEAWVELILKKTVEVHRLALWFDGIKPSYELCAFSHYSFYDLCFFLNYFRDYSVHIHI